ncbi:MAG: HAD-IIA family hydrolase [Ignavibacteria bacterium]|nr:HAD-IIA family hydrolase [Ignavibacteria bacterium]MBT8382806.1 HAD-IIA family hydrolase [Ignavibacteria bacterium]MBT8392693.1 HAD-IIA family hydrolase [Ignavibacteria bacterium]NNJ52527.1 HAD-IIA family hydrolase [Ignavibacteriaceae bacterium]NNL21972.1 HAD-IIA family hydrolase [Ignavibacteriaceae bacterium]
MNKKPVLIDFDGVVKIGDLPAPNAKEFFNYLNENKIPACILSNSTLRTGELIKDYFSSHGINLQIPALTAFDAAVSFVKKNYKKVKVYCRDYLIHHFDGMIDEEDSEAVVIGDIEDKWNYEIVNNIFNKVYNGADLIAMHKNKYWNPHGELLIDAGAFIEGIEYSTDKQAILIGKPSKVYFETALNKIGSSLKDEFFMIGDDVENDVIAAQKIGGTGVLIYTGKTEYPLKNKLDKKPDFEIHSLAEAIKMLSA